jgi:site-specific recombinase XerD
MAHLSDWMSRHGLERLSREDIVAFCADRRAAGHSARVTPGSLASLQQFLQERGLLWVLPPVAAAVGPLETLLARYGRYLVEDRGINHSSVSRRLRAARLFLAEYPGLLSGESVIGATAVSAFCTRELPRRSGPGAQSLATALRSFLRFLHIEGVVQSPLAQAVPRVANHKGAGLPRGLPVATVAMLLESCDRRTNTGRRDYAILLLLARLGLRAGEVAALRLEDLKWRSGEFTVQGKGARQDRLPLPVDVGTALSEYIRRSRPRADTRAVFLRINAPIAGLGSGGVSMVVRTACHRCGIPRIGAHRLRHTLASELLGKGSSLVEVGQVLRHCDVETTAIYAKVDLLALDELVVAWPGDAA